MEYNEREVRLGSLWFFIVGPIALFFVFFLARVDLYLTYNDSEQKKNDTMHELRLAQTSIGSVSLDSRNSAARSYRGIPKNKSEKLKHNKGKHQKH